MQHIAPTSSDGVSFTSWKFIAPVLAALGLGTAGGSQFSLKEISDLLGSFPNPFMVTDRFTLLFYVAAIGAIVGLAHSFYRNNWTLVLPSFSRKNTEFKVASWGCLRNILVGALTAVATTWIAFSNTKDATAAPATSTPATTGSTTAAPGATAPAPSSPSTGSGSSENLLSWTVLLSAAAAGLVGSRMASGHVENTMLMDALATSAAAPGSVDVANAILAAKTPADAVAIATGQPVPGVKPPKDIDLVRQISEIQNELLSLFDVPTLKGILTKLGKPLAPDGAGLTLEALAKVQILKPALKEILKDFDVPSVANMPIDAFITVFDSRGIDVNTLKDILTDIHRQALRSKELLSKLPSDWTLPADKV